MFAAPHHRPLVLSLFSDIDRSLGWLRSGWVWAAFALPQARESWCAGIAKGLESTGGMR